MSVEKTENKSKNIDGAAKIDISIRWKVLIGFGVLFLAVYVLALSAFTDIATAAADTQIQEDLTQAMEGIADSVDVDTLLALAETGQANEEGFSDDPRFEEFIQLLDAAHKVEPDAWPYLYIPDPEVENGLFGVVDLWAIYDSNKAYGFMEADVSRSGALIRGFSDLTYRAVDHPIVNDIHNFANQYEESAPWLFNTATGFAEFLEKNWLKDREFGTYTDDFGRWASGYMPIGESQDKPVAAIGVDFQADTVDDVRAEMRSQVQQAFFIAGPILLVLVFIVSNLFTRPLITLAGAAERVGEGDYDVDFSELISERNRDEIDQLASLFSVMVSKVYQREQTLKRQVARLKIEIDESKQKEEVEGIVDTDFFRELQSRANNLRQERKDRTEDTEE